MVRDEELTLRPAAARPPGALGAPALGASCPGGGDGRGNDAALDLFLPLLMRDLRRISRTWVTRGTALELARVCPNISICPICALPTLT